MKKLTLIFAVLLLAGLACSSVQIADPALQGGDSSGSGNPSVNTPDALATVLAEVAQATKNAPTPTVTRTPTEAPDETAAADETQSTGENQADTTATPRPTTGNTGYPTAISLPNPDAGGFKTCLSECLPDGSNNQATFPEKTDTIYFSFEYEDFPVKAPYTRTWTKDGTLWAKYSCLWPGPEAGTEQITLTDPNGLASGLWTVVVTVNGEEVLNETLLIEGDYSYWSPPGYFNGCYGKK